MNEAQKIRNESDYREAIQVLSAERRPPWLLRVLMNALESYRQSRKMGWSRPQNKLGLRVFTTLKFDAQREPELIADVQNAFQAAFAATVAPQDEAFVAELCADPNLMFFVFFHDLREGEQYFEGVTFSLGRRVPTSTRHRDRFDLILDVGVEAGAASGLSRVRAYVDPFRQPIAERPATALTTAEPPAECSQLLNAASRLFAAHQHDQDRLWSHWSHKYIDYFGARAHAVTGTRFEQLSPVKRAS